MEQTMKRLLELTAAISLSLAATAFAVGPAAAGPSGKAKGHIERTTSGSSVNVDRGPNFRPHGWSEGKKKGWDCRVGSRGCKPPGLR